MRKIKLVDSFLKDFEIAMKEARVEEYPDFIVGAEIQLFCWDIVLNGEWERTDLIQMINDLKRKLDRTDGPVLSLDTPEDDLPDDDEILINMYEDESE